MQSASFAPGIETPDASSPGAPPIESALGRAICHAVLLSGLVGALGACSSEQVYNAAQGWRRNECYKLGDLDQRERCLTEADRPYDAYRAATGRT